MEPCATCGVLTDEKCVWCNAALCSDCACPYCEDEMDRVVAVDGQDEDEDLY